MRFCLLILSIFLLSSHASAVYYPYHPGGTVNFTSSNLPIVVISLDEQLKDKSLDERVAATITILSRKDGSRNYMSDMSGTPDFTNRTIFDYHGRIGIKYRGSTSFNNSDKKPFAVRTEDANKKKMDVNVLDMGAHSDWVFLAPYADKSLMRDVLTFDLQRGYFDYTPRARYCELVLEGIYQGIYIVVARMRRGEARVDLPKPGLSGDALTGGYHLEIDRVDDISRADELGFYSFHQNWKKDGSEMNPNLTNPTSPKPYRSFFQYKYPDYEDYSPDQLEYIQNFISDLEDALLSSNFDNPQSGYRSYIDVTSAADYILTQEFTRNIDGYRLSTPLYKYNDAKDPLLKFSIWDFNISMGNVNYLDGQYPSGWVYSETNDLIYNQGHTYSIPFWFPRMMEDEAFVAELRQRWCHYRSTSHSNDHILHKIDSLASLLGEAQVRNFTAWNIISAPVWPNAYSRNTWEEHLDYLRNFVLDRVEWIDDEFGVKPVQTITGGTVMPSVACEGVRVTVKATPAPEEKEFFCWRGADVELLDDPYSETASFTMPGRNVDIYADYVTIGIDGASMQEKRLYPNPAGNFIRFDGAKNEKYMIFDRLGQKLASSDYNGELIDISFLQPGGYILKTEGFSSFFVKK